MPIQYIPSCYCFVCGEDIRHLNHGHGLNEWMSAYDPDTRSLRPYCGHCRIDPLVGMLKRLERTLDNP